MKNKNGEIELLRFVFAIIIMLRHASGKIIIGFFGRAALGVEFFFIVSGYLMALSVKKKMDTQPDCERLGTESFYYVVHKFKGLMPEFLFAWMISFGVAHIDISKTITIREMVNDLMVWIYQLIPVSMAGFSGGEFHMAAWYISAMLLAMAILYPICRKYYDMYTRVIAPLLAIFILGMLQLSYGTVLGPVALIGTVTFRGFPRAIAEISLGAALCPLCEDFARHEITKNQSRMLTILSVICLGLTLAWMTIGTGNTCDTFCVFLIAIVVFVAFSAKGSLKERFDREFCYKAGRLSMVIYMCHCEWAKFFGKALKYVINSGLAQDTLWLRAGALVAYFAVSFATAFFVQWLSQRVRAKKIN